MRLRIRYSRPADRERGAVLVEFALVALLLVTLLAGTFDYGMAWRDSLAVTEAARSGARVGSSLGKDVEADFSLMSSLRATLDSAGVLDDVERVVIYRSTFDDGHVPVTCTNPTPGGPCNVFTGAQVRSLPATSAGNIDAFGCITNSLRCGWRPTVRDDVQLTAQYLGVWIKVRHEYTFPLLGTAQTIERDAVMRLEPGEPPS